MNEEKIWNKGFTAITLTHSLFTVGIYMLIPTIPLFLVTLGAVESQVGVMATAFYISSIITRFLMNALLVRVGKKLVLIAGLILNSIIIALYGSVGSIGVATILRVIQGIGLGTTSTLCATLAVDFLPDTRRGQGLGYFGMGLVVAQAIAPAIALFIRDNYGFTLMFFASAAANLISAAVVFFLIDEPPAVGEGAREKREAKEKSFGLSDLYDRRLIIPSVIIFLYGISRSVDMNFIALFAEDRSFDYLSLYFVIQTMTMFCIRFVIGRFADKKGRDWVLIPGGFALLAVHVTLSLAHSSAIMLLGAFFSGLGVGVVAPNLQMWVFGILEPSRRNVASASFFNFCDIGSAIGAPLMGLMAEKFGYYNMFRISASTGVLYIVLYITIARSKSPGKKKTRNLQRR